MAQKFVDKSINKYSIPISILEFNAHSLVAAQLRFAAGQMRVRQRRANRLCQMEVSRVVP